MGQTRFELVVIWPDGVEPTPDETAKHLEFLKWVTEGYNWGLHVSRDGQDVYSDAEHIHLLTPGAFVKAGTLTEEELRLLADSAAHGLIIEATHGMTPLVLTPEQLDATPVVMTAEQKAQLEASPDWVKMRD